MYSVPTSDAGRGRRSLFDSFYEQADHRCYRARGCYQTHDKLCVAIQLQRGIDFEKEGINMGSWENRGIQRKLQFKSQRWGVIHTQINFRIFVRIP
jgi:hypothetical protein